MFALQSNIKINELNLLKGKFWLQYHKLSLFISAKCLGKMQFKKLLTFFLQNTFIGKGFENRNFAQTRRPDCDLVGELKFYCSIKNTNQEAD